MPSSPSAACTAPCPRSHWPSSWASPSSASARGDCASPELGAGKLTAILGPSGCGKTTLLRSIAGFVAVDGGRILFGRDDVTALPPQARGTAMVFQNYALWPHMSVFDNVAYGLRRKRLPW